MRKLAGIAIILLVIVAGCTSITPKSQNDNDVSSADNSEIDLGPNLFDSTGGSQDVKRDLQSSGDLDTNDQSHHDIAQDEGAGQNSDNGTQQTDVTEDSTNKCPGNPGCACNDNSECFSGFCIEGPNGPECAALCDFNSSCKPGYKCSNVQNTAGDTVFICIYKYINLCRPCMKNEDCANPNLTSKNLCIEFGPEGKFCGAECTKDSDCPEGYKCKVPEGIDQNTKQCMPENGHCPCTKRFKDNAYETECYIENQYGRCYGKRTCDSKCDAKVPELEVCNGIDDDCNGKTDDNVKPHECDITNQYGTCKGQSKCINGQEVCDGTPPAAEVCNGKDDNCNGETDEGDDLCPAGYVCSDGKCVVQVKDTDDDGDPDSTDCAPNDPSINHNAKEICDGKDNNCNGQTDEGSDLCPSGYVCTQGHCVVQTKDTDGDGDPDSTDCAPNDPKISHNAVEICNGADDNCNGVIDEGDNLCPSGYECKQGHCVVQVKDTDGDGDPDSTDCAPNDPSINHNAKEICDGKDNNCNGVVDEGNNLCPSGYECRQGHCVQSCTPVNGGWTPWHCEECNSCKTTVTCTRSCTNPPPSCGGQNCSGPSTKQKSCDEPQELTFNTHKMVFDKCGDNYAGTIPSGVTRVHVKMWGAGGGGGAPGPGGGGAYVSAYLRVHGGDRLEIRVGCGGAKQSGGGGASYVFLNSKIVLVAAGGGGGGADGCSGCSKKYDPMAGAGGAGGPVGGKGQDGKANNYINTGSYGGKGGTQLAGGAGGISNDHSNYSTCDANGIAGGHNEGGPIIGHCKDTGYAAKYQKSSCHGYGNGSGGGGGSGWYGGGSGAAKWTYSGGGGGGGSSYADSSVAYSINSEGGNWNQPGGTSDPDYNGRAGRGGRGTTDSFDDNQQAEPGNDGEIVLTF